MVDSRRLTASSNNILTPLGITFALVDVVGVGVPWIAASVGACVNDTMR